MNVVVGQEFQIEKQSLKVDFGFWMNQNAPVLAGVPKRPDWAISPPPAAPQDRGGLDPECRNEMTGRMWYREKNQRIKTSVRQQKHKQGVKRLN